MQTKQDFNDCDIIILFYPTVCHALTLFLGCGSLTIGENTHTHHDAHRGTQMSLTRNKPHKKHIESNYTNRERERKRETTIERKLVRDRDTQRQREGKASRTPSE